MHMAEDNVRQCASLRGSARDSTFLLATVRFRHLTLLKLMITTLMQTSLRSAGADVAQGCGEARD